MMSFTAVFTAISNFIFSEVSMKFSVSCGDFVRHLSPLSRLIARHPMIPVLEYFFCEVGSQTGGMHVAATNLDATMRTVMPVVPQLLPSTPRTFLLPARRALDALRTFPPQATATLSITDEGHLILQCERTRFRLFSASPESFPTLPDPPGGMMSIQSSHWQEAIQQTMYAVGDEATRYQLAGTKLILEFPPEVPLPEDGREPETVTGRFTLVGTDGHRLAVTEQNGTLTIPYPIWKEWKAEGQFRFSAIIPRKTLADLDVLLESHPSQPIRIGFTNELNFFEVGPYQLYTRNLAGLYPNYEPIVANRPPHEVILDTAGTMQMIRRVSILADELTSLVTLSLSPELLTAQTTSPTLGEASESILSDYQGETLTIGLNGRYLLETLRAIPTSRFRFCFSSPTEAVWFLPCPDQEKTLTTDSRHVIMPMHV